MQKHTTELIGWRQNLSFLANFFVTQDELGWFFRTAGQARAALTEVGWRLSWPQWRRPLPIPLPCPEPSTPPPPPPSTASLLQTIVS